jgi:hypothetical protein
MNINDQAKEETRKFLERQSKVFLESAIGCLLHTMDHKQVAAHLRKQADLLEEYM